MIDLQKAFDAINYDKLLRKLSIIGFSDDTAKWFQSYLANQKFSENSENSFCRNFKHYICCPTKSYTWSFPILDLCSWHADGGEMQSVFLDWWHMPSFPKWLHQGY